MNSRPVTGNVVQRSACLSGLHVGSADIPIAPAVFWEWVEYSASDNASKVLALCCVLEVRAQSFDEPHEHATRCPLSRRCSDEGMP